MEQKDEIARVANEKINYKVEEGKTIEFYLIDKKSDQKDITWEAELPFAFAFLEDENYMYIFSMTTGIPSGAEGQIKEIGELKKSLESFKFNEAEKFNTFNDSSEI